MKISVIVSTYNRPGYLALVLNSLANQTSPGEFEVVIADDGGSNENKYVIESFQKTSSTPIFHAWQEDIGFRLAASRNNACRLSSGEYLVFLDGDCIPRKNFVEKHRKLAEKGYFVTGTRVLLSKTFSQALENGVNSLESDNYLKLLNHFANQDFNKLFSLFYLPVLPRKLGTFNWRKLRGCNFAVWRDDLFRINGFDERFKGWGFEDSDFAVRLINSGIKRKAGNFAVTVFHLHHRELKTKLQGRSWDLLQESLQNKKTTCKNGLTRL